jgi:hypothetical protein
METLNLEEPVMHVRPDDFIGVEKLGTKLITVGLFVNTVEFPNPKVPLVDFNPAVTKLHNLTASSKGNTNILQDRDEQCLLVYGMMKENLMYVKPICIGNYDLIHKSGYDPSIMPSAHTLAPQAVIKKIVKGPGMNTVKIMLVKATGLEKNKRESRSYIVMVFDVETGKLLRTGCVSTNSHKLLVTDVEIMKPFDYSVAIQNAAGINELAGKVKFTLTD